MFESLLKYSSIFLKEAGLLKVPERLLQEVQDWALSVYFTKIKELVEDKYTTAKQRNILVNKILAEKEKRSFKRVKKALEEGDIQYILPYDGNQFAFRLDVFENEPDPVSNLQGNYIENNTMCYLEVKKTKDPDKYDLFYSGNIFKSQNEFKNITFETLNEIWEHELYNKLSKMFDEFDIFLNEIEGFSDSYIRMIVEELIECSSYIKEKIDIKYTNNFVEKSFYFNDQQICVIFYFSNKTGGKGDWGEFISKDEFFLGFIRLFYEPKIPRYLDQYNNVAEKIKKTVRHELQHSIQTFIKRKTKLPYTTEKVPSGNMEVLPFIMPAKLRKNKIPDDVKEGGKNADFNLEHAHRSIEYHTRVADSVNYFKLVINTIPKQFHKLYFEAWINHNSLFKDFFWNIRNIPLPDPRFKDQTIFIDNEDKFKSVFREAYDELLYNSKMFKSFKEHDFEKYKLAVKEFYKEVEYLL